MKLFFSLAIGCLLLPAMALAQQKPDYVQTKTTQVLSNYAGRYRQVFIPPSGPVPGFPSYVADSSKCGALFTKRVSGLPDTLFRYDCTFAKWVPVAGELHLADSLANYMKKIGTVTHVGTFNQFGVQHFDNGAGGYSEINTNRWYTGSGRSIELGVNSVNVIGGQDLTGALNIHGLVSPTTIYTTADSSGLTVRKNNKYNSMNSGGFGITDFDTGTGNYISSGGMFLDLPSGRRTQYNQSYFIVANDQGNGPGKVRIDWPDISSLMTSKSIAIPIPDNSSDTFALSSQLNNLLNSTGGIMSGDLILSSATPTNPLSAAPKVYIDNLITGITWKNAVKVKTTTNVTLSGIQTIDGVAGVADSRILVNSQTDASQNGIWLMKSGTWIRATDADSSDEILTSTVAVTSGTVNKNTQWTDLNTTAPIIGTDAINYGQISGAGTYAASNGVDLTGNVFTLNSSYTRGLFSASSPLSYNSTTGALSISAIPNSTLANSTISGVALGSNLANLSVGSGLVGTAYNGSAAQSWAVDQGYSYSWSATHNFTGPFSPGQISLGSTAQAGRLSFNRGSDGTAAYTLGFGGANDGTEVRSTISSGSGLFSWYTNISGTLAERMRLSNAGYLGLLTNNPTHTLTLANSGNGFAVYNTADQTTNYERFVGAWNSNTFLMLASNGGTGNLRSVAIGSGSVFSFVDGNSVYSSLGSKAGTLIGSTSVTGGAGLYSITGTLAASSGVQNYTGLTPLITQTGTAAYRMLWISPFESTVGSGNKYLIDAGTNTAANGAGTHTSKFSVDNAGNTITAGNITSAGAIQAVASTKTANYTTTANDQVVPCNSTSASLNITLLSTALIGQTYTVDNTQGTANAVTIVGTINGATNYTLNATKYVTLYKTATATNTWRIIANN